MPLLGQPPIRLNLGSVLIGSFVNTMLYTLELASAWWYFRTERGRKDKKAIRWLVWFSLFVDTVGSFAVCANIFTFLVIYLDDDQRSSRSHWTLIVYVMTNSVAAFVVQGFMVYRYWRLSHNYYVIPPIFALMSFSFGASIWLVVTSRARRLRIQRYNDLRVVIIALAGTAFTDMCINIALIWRLHVSRTYNSTTRHLVRRIIMYAVVTSCTTSVAALAVLITYLIYPPSSISTGIAFCLGRVYTLTMLFTLIGRDKMAKDPVLHVVAETEWTESTMRGFTPPLTSSTLHDIQFSTRPISRRYDTFTSTRSRSVSAPPPRITYDTTPQASTFQPEPHEQDNTNRV